MKNLKFKKLFKPFLVLSSLAIAITSLVVPTFALTYDTQSGDIISDNLFDYDKVTVNSMDLTDYTLNNGIFTFENEEDEASVNFNISNCLSLLETNKSYYLNIYSDMYISYYALSRINPFVSFAYGSDLEPGVHNIQFNISNTKPTQLYFDLPTSGTQKIWISISENPMTSFEPFQTEFINKNKYDSLLEDYSNTQLGIGNFISYGEFKIGNTYYWVNDNTEISVPKMISDSILSNNTINLSKVDSLFVNNYGAVDFTFNIKDIPLYNFIKFDSNTCNYNMRFYLKNNVNFMVNVSTNEFTTFDFLQNTNVLNNLEELVEEIQITSSSPNTLSSMFFDSTYATGYNVGYFNGKDYYYNDYQNSLKDINKLETENAELSRLNQVLQNNINSGYNPFRSIILTIIDAPFSFFNQMWNFDILGFNIAEFVLGILTLFIVIWVFKKIF